MKKTASPNSSIKPSVPAMALAIIVGRNPWLEDVVEGFGVEIPSSYLCQRMNIVPYKSFTLTHE
jgi:hypothetical protein